MTNKQTAVEWIEKIFEEQTMISAYAFEDQLYFRKLLKQAKELEKEQEYETKAFWFGRGVLAEKENRIEELKPNKD